MTLNGGLDALEYLSSSSVATSEEVSNMTSLLSVSPVKGTKHPKPCKMTQSYQTQGIESYTSWSPVLWLGLLSTGKPGEPTLLLLSLAQPSSLGSLARRQRRQIHLRLFRLSQDPSWKDNMCIHRTCSPALGRAFSLNR